MATAFEILEPLPVMRRRVAGGAEAHGEFLKLGKAVADAKLREEELEIGREKFAGKAALIDRLKIGLGCADLARFDGHHMTPARTRGLSTP